MKKSIGVVVLFCLVFISANFVIAKELQSESIPYKMKPGTILIYDEHLKPKIIKGGYEGSEYSVNVINSPKKPILGKVTSGMSEEEIKQVQLENKIVMDAYENGDYIQAPELEIFEGMKVVYDENTGYVNNVYYPDENEPSGYSIHNSPISRNGLNENMIESKNVTNSATWTWGASNNTLTYQAIDDSFLGTGRATYFTGTYGNRDNILRNRDCATKMAYDYSKKGDKDLSIRNLNTNEAFIFYQADVGSMGDAIIDIWGLNNLHVLAGKTGVTSVSNVRYYHKRFSDQSIPR